MQRTEIRRAARCAGVAASAACLVALVAGGAVAQQGMPPGAMPPGAAPGGAKAPEWPPLEGVLDGLTQVVSTTDGSTPLYELHADREAGRLMAVLPRNYESQLLMIACTITGGNAHAGVMGPTHYAKWRKIGKQLALVAPNFSVRTNVDKQSKDSVEGLYTGRVIASVPIVTMAPQGRPVIDIGAMGTQQAVKFFGTSSIFGPFGPSVAGLNPKLASLTKAKAFPENIIFEYEAPAADGTLVRIAYSVGKLEGSKGFKPRKADNRVGFFYDWHQDFGRQANADVMDRYISRWNIEKADPKLKMSPPKQPVVWYIEHTTPIEYRRWVRDGILLWNSSFEKVGIVGAMEVYQQDSTTGAHMDLDPEDARYNFFRWNASDQGYAIGPSRTNPLTGEILDADVVWHQGLTRSVRNMLEGLSDDIVEQGFGPEAIAFFEENPNWDPRVRMATPARREQIERRIALRAADATEMEMTETTHPWTAGTHLANCAMCKIGNQLSMDLALADVALMTGLLQTEAPDNPGATLDGMPEEFMGPMIRYIAAHEVGHCIGLQHNMAASSIRTLKEINTPGFEGPTVGSVMDYVAVNINYELGEVQGPYATPVVGPYDDWAVAYGYGPEDQLEEVLKRVSEPDCIFISQPAIGIGSDPRNMTWEMGADNLVWAESRLGLVQDLRSKLIETIVDEGEPWSEVRRRYQQLLGTHITALFVASRWIGSTYTNNDYKGDPGDRAPLEDVPADKQREALNLIMANAFEDEAFGLTPELIRHMGKEYWFDPAGFNELIQDPSLTVHDMVGGIQAAAMTFVMNPTTLRRVYDNEYRTNGTKDAFTLAELVSSVTSNVWRELNDGGNGSFSAAEPMCSSFRRNLQREHVARLVDLALLTDETSPSLRTIGTLAVQELEKIDGMAESAQGRNPDPYTGAHLSDVRRRIAKAMDAQVVLSN